MNTYLDRIYHFKGTPHEIGFSIGRALRVKLEQNLSHYIANLESSTDEEKANCF